MMADLTSTVTLEQRMAAQSQSNLGTLARNDATLRDHRLEKMVATALERWPAIAYKRGSNRAAAAADLVREEKVHYEGTLGPVGPFESDDDHWVVDGHHCSVRRRQCDCQDRQAPRDARYGRLCKHRLAAMMQMKLNRSQQNILDQIFQAAQTAIVIEVRVNYTGSVRTQRNRLTGWRTDDDLWVRLERRDEEIGFSFDELQDLMQRYGWQSIPGRRINLERHAGGRERWFLERTGASSQTARRLYGWDAEIAAERRLETTTDRMFSEQTAAAAGA